MDKKKELYQLIEKLDQEDIEAVHEYVSDLLYEKEHAEEIRERIQNHFERFKTPPEVQERHRQKWREIFAKYDNRF